MSTPSDERKERLIQAHLRSFVPLSIVEIWLAGAVSAQTLERAHTLSIALAEHGDTILFLDESHQARKGGFHTQAMYEKLVEAVATLAFYPGGVTSFGCHFDAAEVRQGWGITDPPPSGSGRRVDPAVALPMRRALARLEMRWFGFALDHLEALLPIAVLDLVRTWQTVGGPPEDEIRRITASLKDLEQRGDDLFVRKAGESQRRFVQVARVLAVLSFLPAGVTCFGLCFQGSALLEKGWSALHTSPEPPWQPVY